VTTVVAQRPAALANLKETPVSTTIQENGSYCTFHGKQSGLNCPECDKHFPEVVAARALDAAPLSMGILPADVQKMIDAAVKQAVGEQQAFQTWKNSTEGQAAAAQAKTAGVTVPDHTLQLGDPVSTVVPVGPQMLTLAEWEAAGYPANQYNGYVARFNVVA
jgi:hypothetical protein